MAWLVKPKSAYDIIHGYRVIEEQGRGAFGQVFKADAIESNECAAVKILLPDVREDKEYLNSFRRGVHSMQILSKRNVPGIVKILDAYEVPACVFMEFIEGPTMTQAVEWGLLDSLERRLETICQVGMIVHRAHQLNEHVLHRDLKPDNVILRDCYSTTDLIAAVVLDFDLSWHKGAMDMSVVHGARAQGYAAPEQTATAKRQSGISTRHTGVDVFGYGMLAYFLLMGRDPRPNEQNFDGFADTVRRQIDVGFSTQWQCLSRYLAETIRQCTHDQQSQRIPFAAAVESFRTANQMTTSDVIRPHSTVVLLELACKLDPDANFAARDHGREVTVVSSDHSKQVVLKLRSQNDRFYVDIRLSKVRREGEHRSVVKYLNKARDKACSALNVRPFEATRGDIGLSRLEVKTRYPLPKSVSNAEIRAVADSLLKARASMELG